MCTLLDGRLGGAAVDCPEGVTWLEAWVREIPNLIVTPHVGFFSDQAFAEQRKSAVDAIRAFLGDYQKGDLGGPGGGFGGREGEPGGWVRGPITWDCFKRFSAGGTSLVLANDDSNSDKEHELSENNQAGEGPA